MTWKVIGQSVLGTSHLGSGRPCEDSISYDNVKLQNGGQVLLCAISDGAGSAKYAKEASQFAVAECISNFSKLINAKEDIDEQDIYIVIEDVCLNLRQQAQVYNTEINEFSCTLLGCIVFPHKAIFYQIGDGALIINDDTDFYNIVWWPQNGEYQNTTYFLIDDESLSHLKVTETTSVINEIAILSDGLQLLALQSESQMVFQPFFRAVFLPLRMADTAEKLAVLNGKLFDYLNSDVVNSRTDDDKTLFLASRITYDRPNT